MTASSRTDFKINHSRNDATLNNETIDDGRLPAFRRIHDRQTNAHHNFVSNWTNYKGVLHFQNGNRNFIPQSHGNWIQSINVDYRYHCRTQWIKKTPFQTKRIQYHAFSKYFARNSIPIKQLFEEMIHKFLKMMNYWIAKITICFHEKS